MVLYRLVLVVEMRRAIDAAIACTPRTASPAEWSGAGGVPAMARRPPVVLALGDGRDCRRRPGRQQRGGRSRPAESGVGDQVAARRPDARDRSGVDAGGAGRVE